MFRPGLQRSAVVIYVSCTSEIQGIGERAIVPIYRDCG